MYPAKAEAIAKAAFAAWVDGDFSKSRDAVVKGVFVATDDQSTTVDDLDEIDGFPKALRHGPFLRLCRALAVNPLVA